MPLIPMPCLRLAQPFALALTAPASANAEVPREWIDADTGHRVVRLSDEPGTSSLYFHQWSFTPDGRSVVVTSPRGIATLDFTTRALTPLVGPDTHIIQLGRRTGSVYFTRTEGEQLAVFSLSLDTRTEHRIALLPPRATVSTDNDVLITKSSTLLLSPSFTLCFTRHGRHPETLPTAL